MKVVYTSKSAFDAWEKMGNPGWNWDSILPYFRRFHTHHASGKDAQALAAITIEGEPFESNQGPIQTSYSGIGELEKAWYASWKQIMTGLEYKGDNFGGFLAAASIDPKTKTRSYAATGYFHAKVASRSNLRVITEALVEKIIFEKGSEIIASGVQFVSRTGDRFTAKATREVILSAGAIKSPQLLEISGIGSSKVLSRHGINVVVENPDVGEHLQDHPLVLLSFEVADGVCKFNSNLYQEFSAISKG
jgi:choline dehydrogenase-like flavoprotein